MTSLEIELPFDELMTPSFGVGMLLYGTAYLQDAGDGDFFVQSVKLDGGPWIRPVREGGTLEAKLYQEIAAVLYDKSTHEGRKAAEEWAMALADSRLPDPDRAYDERRDACIHAHFAASE
ncbi:hypothetical protein [Pararhizobium antarcticum]|uniref:Uncharacterized protein n=1 Tax=Pararhizobium antarcticum TaxID=1798805 RepID=A0A657LSW7_9HYPH|nr:hypothetical protein [Pararhizobium antarcticum]OJF97608.1 hypothetical protein AX760_16745 [Pararhizobium antarcticum]